MLHSAVSGGPSCTAAEKIHVIDEALSSSSVVAGLKRRVRPGIPNRQAASATFHSDCDLLRAEDDHWVPAALYDSRAA
jgi:hypothetical protein